MASCENCINALNEFNDYNGTYYTQLQYYIPSQSITSTLIGDYFKSHYFSSVLRPSVIKKSKWYQATKLITSDQEFRNDYRLYKNQLLFQVNNVNDNIKKYLNSIGLVYEKIGVIKIHSKILKKTMYIGIDFDSILKAWCTWTKLLVCGSIKQISIEWGMDPKTVKKWYLKGFILSDYFYVDSWSGIGYFNVPNLLCGNLKEYGILFG